MTDQLDGIPHLKLPPNRLIPVIEAVRDEQPDRSAVEARVMRSFPGKKTKSVFRGMVIPATTRLDLVRATSAELVLSPNGTGIFSAGLSPSDFIGLLLRAVAIRRFGLEERLACVPGVLRLESSGKEQSVRERALRFAAYLHHFSARPQAWQEAGFARLPGPDYAIEIPAQIGSRLIREVLPRQRLINLDLARRRLMERLWREKWLVTSFDVDALLIKLFRRKDSRVRLWRQSSRSIDEILIGGRSYGSLTVMET